MSFASAVRTRFVRPEPPHEPEPRPDEPFAAVYDHRPLSMGYDHGGLEAIRPPRHPDQLVFGGQGQPKHDPSGGYAPCWCARCDVRWAGDAPCWNCGSAAT